MDNWPVRGNLEEWLVCSREEVSEKDDSFHLPRIFQVCEHFLEVSQPLSSYRQPDHLLGVNFGKSRRFCVPTYQLCYFPL